MKSRLFSVEYKDLPGLASANLSNLTAYSPTTEFIHSLYAPVKVFLDPSHQNWLLPKLHPLS